MTPMMELDPQRRPVLSRKRRAAVAAAASAAQSGKVKSAAVVRVIAASVLCGLALGIFVWAAARSRVKMVVAPPSRVLSADKLVEQDNRWVDRLDEVVPSEKLRQAMRENPDLQPGHRQVKTGSVIINLRTLESPPRPPEDGKQSKPPEIEAGGMSGEPVQVRAPEGEKPPPPEPGPEVE